MKEKVKLILYKCQEQEAMKYQLCSRNSHFFKLAQKLVNKPVKAHLGLANQQPKKITAQP